MEQPNERMEFRELLLKNNVIVLASHVHFLEYIRCETDSGHITQLITSGVWVPSLEIEPLMQISGPPKYTTLNPKLRSRGQVLLAEYKDAITEYSVLADKKATLGSQKYKRAAQDTIF